MRWNLRTKLCCIAPEKRNASRDSLQAFCNSNIMFWIDNLNYVTVACWLAHRIHVGVVRDRFLGGEFTNLLFNYFNGSNEGIIAGVAEMRGFMIKRGERPLDGWEYVKFP